ncbi:MAG: OmpH family outer membrane protein [Kiritimatiellia bacterium]
MWLKNILAVLCVSLLAGAAAAAELKLACVSMERLFDEYHRTTTFNEGLKARAATLEARREKLALEVRARQRDLETLEAEARDPSLSAEGRDSKRRQAESAYTRVREAEEAVLEFDRTEKRRFGEEMRDAQQELVKEIRAVIADYARRNGFTLVLDSSGKTLNGVEAVVYSDDALDLTETILAILNRGKAKE